MSDSEHSAIAELFSNRNLNQFVSSVWNNSSRLVIFTFRIELEKFPVKDYQCAGCTAAYNLPLRLHTLEENTRRRCITRKVCNHRTVPYVQTSSALNCNEELFKWRTVCYRTHHHMCSAVCQLRATKGIELHTFSQN